jgi:hypothetical protein
MCCVLALSGFEFSRRLSRVHSAASTFGRVEACCVLLPALCRREGQLGRAAAGDGPERASGIVLYSTLLPLANCQIFSQRRPLTAPPGPPPSARARSGRLAAPVPHGRL